jgi:hypothetical protein
MLFFLRLVKERLGFVRPLTINALAALRKAKAMIAMQFRSYTYTRLLLNLPAANPVSWKEWLVVNPDEGFEIPIDSAQDLSIPLPEGTPLDMEWFFDKESKCHLQASFVAGINRGGVWNHHGGIYFSRRRELIWDLGREHWLDICISRIPAAMNRWYLPKSHKIAGTCAVLASPDAFANFGHWCLDVLPKAGLLERSGWGPDRIDYYLIGHTDKDFQLQSLETVGIPSHKILRMADYQFLQADLLLLPFLNSYHFTSFQPSSISYLRTMFQAESFSSSQRYSEKIFISRADAGFRHVSNENELRLALEPLGFEFVTLGGLGLQETARLMGSAKVIVAPNGSGLMCVLFAQPGAFVLEFSHTRYTTSFHWKLCYAAGLRYAHIVSDDEPVARGIEQRYLYADVCIHPSRLIAALDNAGVL